MLLSALLFAASTVVPATTTPAAKQELNSAVGAILRAQGATAKSALEAISPADLDAKDRAFRTCALSRLTVAEPTPAASEPLPSDPFVRDLLALYRRYWRVGALDEGQRPQAEKALIVGLGRLLDHPVADVAAAEPLITARLKALGWSSLEGTTGVLHELMIWRRETRKIEQVELPEGSNATRVHYLDGFISRGWSSYFTCHRTGTGGWTTGDGLFVVVPNYDSLSDENFRVNFLAHESQHFSDMKRFGELPGWRLEYRAKLVEVAYADTTMARVLGNFARNQGDDSTEPHSYADKRVLKALEDRLGVSTFPALLATPTDRLHQTAVAVLKADSVELSAERRTK